MQDFYDEFGNDRPVAAVAYVDGTAEIQRVVEASGTLERLRAAALRLAEEGVPESRRPPLEETSAPPSIGATPPAAPAVVWEGALVGSRPFLYPFPVVALFAFIFSSVLTGA